MPTTVIALETGRVRVDEHAQRVESPHLAVGAVDRHQRIDAAGLALFAVSGTQKALGHGLDPVMAALLGMLTGIGGGMVSAQL